MAVLEDPPVRSGIADQSQVRTTVPATGVHDDHDDQQTTELRHVAKKACCPPNDPWIQSSV